MMYEMTPTAIAACQTYDPAVILPLLTRSAAQCGITKESIEGKNVAIKPNLLLAVAPEKAATTHPAVLEAVIALLRSYQPASIVIAESPGGPFTPATLRAIYKATGLTELSERTGVPLNFDTSYEEHSYDNGMVCKSFPVLNALWKADVIVNVCKLKTHSLTGLSCSVKNLFGTIPGTIKFEMHARFHEAPRFFEMLLDLCNFWHETHTVFSVCDGIVGMEGNGPSGGLPRPFGVLLMGRSPYCLDATAAALLGLDENEVPMLRLSGERGYAPMPGCMPETVGDDPDALRVKNLVKPDTKRGGKKFEKIPKFLQPRPIIDQQVCRGCGVCAKSCPVHTIEMREGKAFIVRSHCIRCYCCQELCIFKAVKIHHNRLIKIAH